jgi:hypothetical protein
MILVKATEQSEAGEMPPEELFDAMAAYHEELAKAGVLLDASGLKPSSTAWRVRWSKGAQSVVDGPFSESKELVAGYTLIQTKTRAEAEEWVRRFPNPAGRYDGEIEVRELFELDDFEPSPAIERFRDLALPGSE